MVSACLITRGRDLGVPSGTACRWPAAARSHVSLHGLQLSRLSMSTERHGLTSVAACVGDGTYVVTAWWPSAVRTMRLVRLVRLLVIPRPATRSHHGLIQKCISVDTMFGRSDDHWASPGSFYRGRKAKPPKQNHVLASTCPWPASESVQGASALPGGERRGTRRR